MKKITNLIFNKTIMNKFLPNSKFNFHSVIDFNFARKNTFNKIQCATFAKNDKNSKNEKSQKEKDTINKEYAGITPEQLKSKYKQKSDTCITALTDALTGIRVQRSNPKILDNIQVIYYFILY